TAALPRSAGWGPAVTYTDPHAPTHPRRRRARRHARADPAHHRGAGPSRRPAGPDRRLGRPGQRGGGRGRPAHVPPAAADQRHPARRGAPRPHRRAGAGHGPAGGGPALRGAPDPGRGVSGPMTTTSTTGADLVRLTAVQMADGLAAGDFTSEQLVQAHLDRIERLNPALNVFLHIDAEGALATAREVDRRRAAGEQLPRLAGVPVAVKDIVCTEGIPTTAGSRML